MTRIIVITSGKGGVGKTTATSNIGMALALLKRKVLLIDADVGLRNLDLLLGLENRIIYTGLDVVEGNCLLEQTLIRDKRERHLTFFPLSSSQVSSSLNSEHLQEFIKYFENRYEFILIDSPAGIDEGFINAIEFSQEALIVVTPEVTSVRDADKVIGILQTRGIHDIKLIINRVRPNMIQDENMMSLDDVSDILGIPIIGIVPDSEQVIIASNRGEPLVLDEKLSVPGLSFEHIARRLDGEDVPFIDISNTSKNPIKKILKSIIKRSKNR